MSQHQDPWLENTLILLGLFGEGPADRRERLRQLLSILGEDAIKKKQEKEAEEKREKVL